jgi:hypothetical protein
MSVLLEFRRHLKKAVEKMKKTEDFYSGDEVESIIQRCYNAAKETESEEDS